jgi:PKD repeat protein
VIEVKPKHPAPGQRVTFNAAQSFDDRTPASKLKFRWDFNHDGRTDSKAPTARHKFAKKGRYPVRLTVIDAGHLRTSKTVIVRVGKTSSAATTLPAGLRAF